MSENLKKVVLYCVLYDIIADTHTNSDSIRSMYSLFDRLTDNSINIEKERNKKEFDTMYNSLYKELSKLA